MVGVSRMSCGPASSRGGVTAPLLPPKRSDPETTGRKGSGEQAWVGLTCTIGIPQPFTPLPDGSTAPCRVAGFHGSVLVYHRGDGDVKCPFCLMKNLTE